jgi:hypothetical protein
VPDVRKHNLNSLSLHLLAIRVSNLVVVSLGWNSRKTIHAWPPFI